MRYFFCFVITFGIISNAFSRTPEGFADVVDKILPAVVSVAVTKSSENSSAFNIEGTPNSPFDNLLKESVPNKSSKNNAVGSGFVIDPSGIIMTNYHVVENFDEITVTLHDGKSYLGDVIGYDKKTDIALVKITVENAIKAVRLGDSDNARVGDWILAVGNPFGLGNSVTAGIISAIARDINSGPYDDFIQTDAPINQGNSGGPMFNMNGEVVGINTAIFSPQGGSIGIGFAIPSNMARWVAENLIKYGAIKRGMLGVKIQAISTEIAESMGLTNVGGVLVAEVDDDSPAKDAGIMVGDIITKFNDEPLKKPKHLPKMVAESEIDKEVKLSIIRAKKEIKLKVKIAEMSDDFFENNAKKAEIKHFSGDVKDIPELDIKVVEINQKTKEKYKLKDKSNGVVVVLVGEKSEAKKKNLKEGNIIKEIASIPVKMIADVEKIIAEAKLKQKHSVLILVEGDSGDGFIALKIK